MDADDLVRAHYRRDGLEAVVLGAVRDAGLDPGALSVGDLAGLDQLHAGGIAATEHLLDALALGEDAPLLDVGSGIGGPARLAAHRHGCRVTGVDLSPDFVEVARALTARLGLDDVTDFQVAPATALPFADASFSRAMMNHVGMNIADKAAVFAEVRRVLEPGGLFAVYDQMRVGDGELTFPLPWADTEDSSFVETAERYADLLAGAGFRVERDEDRTAANAAAGPPAGALTPGALFGPGFGERLANNIVAAMTGTLAARLIVACAV